MKKFLDRLKDKGYKISGSKAFLLGVEFTICSGYIHTAIGRQKSYWLELKRIRDEDYDLLCYNELKLKRKERNQMEDKKNAVIVVDFGQNTFGGYFIKYSDGSIRSLCKEQLIEILNNKREA